MQPSFPNPDFGRYRGNTPLVPPFSASDSRKGKGKEKEQVVAGVEEAVGRRVTRGQLSEHVAQIDAMHDRPETNTPISAVPSRLHSFVSRHLPPIVSPRTTDDEDHHFDFLRPQVGPHTQASETIQHEDGTETLRPPDAFYSYPKGHRTSEMRMARAPVLLRFVPSRQALMDPYENNLDFEESDESAMEDEVGFEARKRELMPGRD